MTLEIISKWCCKCSFKLLKCPTSSEKRHARYGHLIRNSEDESQFQVCWEFTAATNETDLLCTMRKVKVFHKIAEHYVWTENFHWPIILSFLQ